MATENWANEEFRSSYFGDKRISKRLIQVVNNLSFRPDKTINGAIEDYSSTKACYRFFENEQVTKSKILSPHVEQTHARMKKHSVVLAIQDTTFINYNRHKQTTGLGSIGKYPDMENPVQGVIAHTTLAFTPLGLPLGLLDQAIWSRPEKGHGLRGRDTPIEEKESYKWIEALDNTLKFNHDKTQVITVADRECDIFEFYQSAINYKADLIVRAKHDRMINGGDNYLSWHLDKKSDAGEIEVEVPTKERKTRKAKVSLTFSKITFESPKSSLASGSISLYVVNAKEKEPAKNVDALEWTLLTTLPIMVKADAEVVIGFYRMRWHIESYFKVLKTGCKVEDCRLETKEKLEKYITLMSVVAWRLYWMTHMNRYAPDIPCTVVLTDAEWKALWTKINKEKIKKGLIKKKPPKSPLTVREALVHIAKMGGFNGRKGDGHPGMISIWRGWIRLQDMTEMWEIMN